MNAAVFLDGNDPLGGVSLWSLRIARCLADSAAAVATALDDSSTPQQYAAQLLSDYAYSSVVATDPHGQASSPANGVLHWSELSPSAKECVLSCDVFIPNYFEFAYRLAAIGVIEGRRINILAICHTDEDYYYYLIRKYCDIISTFIAVSTRCKRRLTDIIPGRRNDIFLVPYGTMLQTSSGERTNVRSPVRLLYVGRIEQRQKRALDLARIASALVEAQCPFELRIVGEGSCRDELEKLLAFLPRPHVTFLGVKVGDQLTSQYRWADILLITSATEGLPFALLEAMSFGVVPVVTRVSGNEDIVLDQHNGAQFDVDDVYAAATAISTFSADREFLAAASKNARDSIAGPLAWEAHVSAIKTHVQRIRSKPTPTPNDAQRALASRLTYSF